jgi:hypothetical protein
VGEANLHDLGPLKPQKHMIWCTYIGKTFCQVWTYHKLVNTTQKLQFGVMVTEKSFCDNKLPLFVESPLYRLCKLGIF